LKRAASRSSSQSLVFNKEQTEPALHLSHGSLAELVNGDAFKQHWGKPVVGSSPAATIFLFFIDVLNITF
tara:strand:+ start:116 stop:325 length:210 start_codon:yes stop_codon:yes gene_type:complete